jgi:hypothetical protein
MIKFLSKFKYNFIEELLLISIFGVESNNETH